MLAIVIPYYKYTFFKETLESLANQTDKRFNVYIGDDASPEDCSDLINKYQERFNLKYHRFETNLGGTSLTQQWERCIDLIDDTSIEWVQILGDDDVLGKNVVEEFYKNIKEVQELEIKVIRYATQKIDEKNHIISSIYTNPNIEDCTNYLIRENKRGSLSEHIFNLNSLKNKNFRNFPLAWHSDIVAVLEVSDFKNIFSINNSIVLVRMSDLNISGRKDLIIQKTKATSQYYIFLSKYLNLFSEKQKILNQIKNFYLKNNKKNIRLFSIIIKKIWENDGLISVLKFIYSIFNYKIKCE